MQADAATQLDEVIRRSFDSLGRELLTGQWKGQREREVISLYCFGHLLRHCVAGTVLHNPTQIAIEVAVPQVPGQKALSGRATSKDQVCKDIVLWPQPGMVAWDDRGVATVSPLSVIEWKHNEGAVSKNDVEWLAQFSEGKPTFVGYAVSTNHPARPFTLSCTRVAGGKSESRWFHLA